MLKRPLPDTEHGTIHVPRKTITGKLQPIKSEDIEVSNILWTKDDTDTTHSPVELLNRSHESSFQQEHNNTKHSIGLQVAQIPQEVKDKLHSLPEGDYDTIISKSPMDVGRTNLFQMDIQTG